MKTYEINNQSELEQFKDEYGYKVKGNLDVKCSLDIKKRLYVEGHLYIKAGGSIKAGEYIKAGGSIEAGGYIKAGGYIEAGESIEAGGSYGISAGLQITCRDKLTFGLKCFAGICTWRKIIDEEKTITCGKFEGGVVEYGILRETGLKDSKVKIMWEGKTVEISRESAKALNLIK